MNAPGSPSSALQMTALSEPFASRTNCHFIPVGNPAPPRPRRPDVFISAITSSGDIEVTALPSASYPPAPMYSSIDLGVDRAAVRKHDLLLLLEERDRSLLMDDPLRLFRAEQETRHDAPLEEVLAHDLVDVGDRDALVEHALGVHEDERPVLARAHAAGLDDARLLGEAVGDDLPTEFLSDLAAVRRYAGAAGADQHFKTARHDYSFSASWTARTRSSTIVPLTTCSATMRRAPAGSTAP